MSERWGATPGEWAHFQLILGLGKYLLPCVRNPDAKISPRSKLKNLGQIPSQYNSEGMAAGIANWTTHDSSEKELEKWSQNPDYSICLRAAAVRALDCDLPDAVISEAVLAFMQEKFADIRFPLRGRSNSPKFLLAFRLAGQHDKRVIKIDDRNKIEFLADKQQFIAAGTHPSGVRYEWAGGLPIEIPEIAPDQFETIWKALADTFGTTGKPEEYRERKAAGALAGADASLDALEAKSLVLGYGNEGQAYISCPFKAGHSKEGDMTETAYFPAGLRGYDMGHFKCLHASCSGRTDEDFLDAIGLRAEAFADLGPLPGEPPKLRRFPLIPVADYAARPPPRWIIKEILPRAELAVIFGESGSGKTFVALDIAFSAARGVVWNGHDSQPCRVVYIAAEGSGGLRNRIKAYARHTSINLKETPFQIIAGAPNFLIKDDTIEIIKSIKELGQADIVFVDTLAQTTPGANENAAEDMGKAIAACKSIYRETGALVVLIHHAGKDLERGARGWSGLKAAADAEIEISREGESRFVKISKQKDGEDGMQWGFKLLNIDIEIGDDDKTVSSCVVEYTGRAEKKRKEKKRGENETAVLKAFDELGGVSVSINSLIDKAITFIPYDPETRDQRRATVRRAIASLSRDGVFNATENLVEQNLN